MIFIFLKGYQDDQNSNLKHTKDYYLYVYIYSSFYQSKIFPDWEAKWHGEYSWI